PENCVFKKAEWITRRARPQTTLQALAHAQTTLQALAHAQTTLQALADVTPGTDTDHPAGTNAPGAPKAQPSSASRPIQAPAFAEGATEVDGA
ncbi:hypothetical protein, partial [Micromonospora saelicesensis]|uniref:hypothetical protein n=1 Tax=Micromonospora saelicesensis TaxID=285676 RepID=UPI001C65F2F2